ncbi:hypothetical protein P7C73_g942, partial [Tremellales sp. Uapishka_1]
MSPRPAYSSRTTATLLSTISHSTDRHSIVSTALTSPSLGSPPRKGVTQIPHMPLIYEGSNSGSQVRDSRYDEDIEMTPTVGNEVLRGPSVRDRASRFEQSSQPSGSKPPPATRTRSTSPLRFRRKTSHSAMTSDAQTPRRLPVPSTAPARRSAHVYEEPESLELEPGRKRTPPELKRGTGSAKRMIQQWERSLPGTPMEEVQPRYPGGSERSTPMSARAMSREYLDQKPLPLPRATTIPASSPHSTASPGLGRPLPSSRARTSYAPSPLQHLQTPTQQRKRSSTMTSSPSGWSLSPSPSGEKKRKQGGRSPLRELLGVFGGGIQAMGRKAKGKGKDNSGRGDAFGVRGGEGGWVEDMSRVGSNGLPGGIVFSDRMGDQEMDARLDPNVIRTSAVIYLIPTPCSSLAQWGSWLPSYATLTSKNLNITYSPLFGPPAGTGGSGNSTPRRVFSGISLNQTPVVAYSSIPIPQAGTPPDVALAMSDCVEVRSLRREEVRGRGVPSVPEGVGTEVLELVWSDGSKRYLGVEGVGGRLGWVSAIWDVLLACKSTQPQALPPPSPIVSLKSVSQGPTCSIASLPYPSASRPTERLSDFQTRIANLESRSSAPPVQKVGDTWVAASVLGKSDVEMNGDRGHSSDDLRDSVQRMFDAGPDPGGAAESRPEWQPESDRQLSIFARNTSKTYSEIDRINGFPKSETALSFDPDDLNPSRSASQVRRASTVMGGEEPIRKYGPKPSMPVLEESGSLSGSEESTLRPPRDVDGVTHISHVSFPKPTLGGAPLNSGNRDALPKIESVPSSCEGTEYMRTPQTEYQSSATSVSTVDPTVIAKLDSHTNEHGSLAKQVDGVTIDLNRVIRTLGTMVQQSRTIPKALDDKLVSLQLDVKGVENALQLSNLASNRRSPLPVDEPKLPDVNQKLDNIVKLCEDLLSRPAVAPPKSATPPIDGLPIRASRVGNEAKSPKSKQNTLGLVVESDEEKSAGEEVAQIMADLTGGSSKSKTSPKLGGVQVLHTISAPSSPRPLPGPLLAAPSDELNKQVGEVLSLVKELQGARTVQTQQTSDIARYLSELNSWLEKFVLNGTSELSSMNARLTTLMGTEGTALPDIHGMLVEQKMRQEADGMLGHRLDSLLRMMGEDKERQAAQQSTVEHVLGILERQRQDNESLLRALATDLTGEIRGERIRFVEAMQQATSVNVQLHIDEFKKLLSTEVHKSMKELGQMREQKKVLEHQISDLFALKAKHGSHSGSNSRQESAAPSPQNRGLPAPPPRR